MNYAEERKHMVEAHIRARGVRDEKVLSAMIKVPRERFVPREYRHLAYDDAPLPIGENQTISQPYIVAYMIEALALKGGERALEIGAGSGYAAAVLAQICRDVFAIERIEKLSVTSAETLRELGIKNIHTRFADGSSGWPEQAPFDAIIVSAGAPLIPAALKKQLAIGGRMVVPVGKDLRAQELVRVTRVSEDEYLREDIADVRFVPLIGKEGWELEEADFSGGIWRGRPRVIQSRPETDEGLPALVSSSAEPFESLNSTHLQPLLNRIGDARIVLLGEATHGTTEFYQMRQRITQALIKEKGFSLIAVEADWPDAARIDHYVRHKKTPAAEWTAFARFPTWMWRNTDVQDFVDWLHDFNTEVAVEKRVGFHGLDVYSLYTSVREVVKFLEDNDPVIADVARKRYACLSPWETDPAAYGHAAIIGRYQSCEKAVLDVLLAMLQDREKMIAKDEAGFFNAVQNAKVVANAEQYYRIMYHGSRASWNLRDNHMFETLKVLLEHYGPESKAVVWAHNSHIGDASATEMSARGEFNIGQLVRREFGENAYNIGFGTDTGIVAAASEWDGPIEYKSIQPSHTQSYERLFHLTNKSAFFLPLTRNPSDNLRAALSKPKLERAIGVVYRPETEQYSHYFEAKLADQFDEYIWFDVTNAITPLDVASVEGLPDTYPFGV
jgi:protein-L-isoaspartate(D-aspartate) O-methyltransferase